MVPYPGTEVYDIAKAGEHGMRLLCEDFREFVRYENAVIEVNDLKKKDLVFYQKLGLMLFYLSPRRVWYNLRRAGWRTGFKNALAFLKGIFHH